MKQIVVWGLRKGETESWKEELLCEICRNQSDIDKVVKAATADGWHSIRIAKVDLSKPPDFANTIN